MYSRHIAEFADIDECSLSTDDCHNLATCENTGGSYICTCLPGYSGDAVSFCESELTKIATMYSHWHDSDIDINECQLGTDNCDINSDCVDIAGSFNCTCHHGYSKTLNEITCSMALNSPHDKI